MLLFKYVLQNSMYIRRLCSTTIDCSVNVKANHLSIQYGNLQNLRFPYFWLRDHCRCPKCYTKNTEQILFNLVDIPLDVTPKTVNKENGKLKIMWAFDDHKSEYSLEWLRSIDLNIKRESCKEIVLWTKEDVPKFIDSKIECKSYINSKEGQKKLLKSIVKYGFGIVTNVEPTLEATEEVVTKMAMVKSTLFGEMWEVTNDAAHSDTAYSQMSLLPHTDNTYFSDASGLQVFHMLSHEGTGGETLLVDGFNACIKLREKHRSAFDLLSTIPTTAKYLEEGYHYALTDAVIKLHPLTKELYQLRYNIFDRDVLKTIPYDGIMDFYKAYILLGKELFGKNAVLQMKLQPGDVIFIDNWRVLHGRESYTGIRRLCGCYVGRDDWISKAQSLALDVY